MSVMAIDEFDDTQDEAPVEEMIKALEGRTTPYMRQIVCDILGELHANAAIPILIKCLEDPSRKVRNAAADALASPRLAIGVLAN